MKKILCAVLIATIMICTTSCSAMFGTEGTDNPPAKTEPVVLTIKGGNYEYTQEVTIGEEARVELPLKNQYFCSGLYSEENGGTKYFDSDGTSTMKWQASFPTTLYAQWEDIHSLSWTAPINFDSTAATFGWKKSVEYTLPSDFCNAIEGNLSETLLISVTFKGMDELFVGTYSETWAISISDLGLDESGREIYATKQITTDKNYKTFTLSFEVDASCAKNGQFVIGFNRGNTFNKGCIKNLNVSVAFE